MLSICDPINKFMHNFTIRDLFMMHKIKTVSKIILVRFININVVKDVIIGSVWLKWVIFGENGQIWVILGTKMMS